ncbi:MAG: glycosyltransferase family 2 protein, partial [Pseudogulbenkiania sp.]|nr:glycosyltransferase family 2 protein [Pseudogulbenkiania sp.]
VRFIKFYLLRQGFRDGVPGLVHISIGCFNSYIKYAKLIELHRLENKQ